MTERIGVALSGGADSALAAWKLSAQGYDVFGLHLLLTRSAESEQLVRHTAETAGWLGIRLEVLDAADSFAARVIAPFCAEYGAGRTPNPCVTCNREIKFDLLLKAALERGADRLATGHYARVGTYGGRPALLRAADRNADQSYFLYAIDAAVLDRLVLPLGEALRRDVRAWAREQGLVSGKSSQDICFLGGRDLHSFVSQHIPIAPGEVVDVQGGVRGRHRGLAYYTVGQRHGLGIALGTPAYVVYLDSLNNRVVIGEDGDLLCEAAHLRDVRWHVPPQGETFRAEARVRYRAQAVAASVSLAATGATVRFEQPQRAVAPGQSVVLYDNDVVLGGGVVVHTVREARDGH